MPEFEYVMKQLGPEDDKTKDDKKDNNDNNGVDYGYISRGFDAARRKQETLRKIIETAERKKRLDRFLVFGLLKVKT